jgi:hypothetical protein
VSEPQHQGFGSTLLQRVLPMQCNAKIHLDYDKAGLQFVMDAADRATAGASLLDSQLRKPKSVPGSSGWYLRSM